ncbi:hypothetical protein P7M27_26330, partial [Vibrio parahaemolyticus]|nr:hypothetical protein [Vibrio parahaemolyticus]
MSGPKTFLHISSIFPSIPDQGLSFLLLLLFFFFFVGFSCFFFVGTEEERPKLYPLASLSSRAYNSGKGLEVGVCVKDFLGVASVLTEEMKVGGRPVVA